MLYLSPLAAAVAPAEGEEDVSVQGTITDFVGTDIFSVAGVAVDASAATLTPRDLTLAGGVIVEVEGLWDGDTLVASTVETHRGQTEIEATVASVSDNSITLQLNSGTVTVEFDNRTMFKDSTGSERLLTQADIRIGDFLEVEAIRLSADTLLATRIDRDNPDDDSMQAAVESFVVNESYGIGSDLYDPGRAIQEPWRQGTYRGRILQCPECRYAG